MLRHAIFVLVLVGAAFAGGAVINGPGLAWLQRNLIGGPTIIVDGSSPASNPPQAARRFPSASPPPLFVDFSPKPVPKGSAPAPAAPAPASGLSAPAGPDLAALATQAVAPSPGAAPGGDPSPAPPLDLPLDTIASATDPAAKTDPTARLASTGGLDPASASSAPSTAATQDWTEIRRRLKALGVSRYSIDAETEGRVRFSCVIPMDGLRAVGHHFEADGDDEFQAVEATLRRVTLWRATEPTRAEP